ncbi:MAG: DNA-binding response regulator [Alphaproteobacteria bacterium]|nr:DNA-binding response regulator [Alphaproteobacteria bacterium]MBF0130158.1 DNA-binding response regulator [Alphaproteobacteria bacterium]
MVETARRPRVLFVDDDPRVLEGLRRSFEGLDVDWELSFQADPLEAERLARDGGFDVIVCDLSMPVLDGLGLLGRLRASGVRSQTIILTGTGDMASAVNAINSVGVFRYYTKPCPAPQLASGIAEAIEKGRRGGLAAAALDVLPFATIAVDRAMTVVFTNRRGAELLVEGDAIMIDRGGICRANTPDASKTFHAAVAAVASSGQPAVLALAGRSGQEHSVLIEPAEATTPGAIAILFIRELDAIVLPDPEAIRTLFHLTASEARLAHVLASGQDVKEAARSIGITPSTARTYLKAIFMKTGVNRQSELIRLLCSSVPGR